MGGFERICWIVTILASIGALAILGTALFTPQLKAPDQGVLAVIGAGIAIVPYIFTRAIQALGRDRRQRAGEKPQAADPQAADPRAADPLPADPRSAASIPTASIPAAPLPASPLPAAEPAPEPARRETPSPAPAILQEPLPAIAEPALGPPAQGPAPAPAPRPTKPLVARERLVPPPPPPPRRSALERAFWVLIGILVVIIAVGIILIRNGP